MPRHCSVFGCKSNYDKNENVTTYSLPKSPKRRAQWLRKIPRDLSKLKNPVICIKHFDESQIIRKDCVIYKNEYKEYDRKIPGLIQGAVPCIFENAPSYLSTNKSKPRRLVDVEEVNYKKAVQESLLQQKADLEKNALKCPQDVVNYFRENICKYKNKWFYLDDDDDDIIRLCLYAAHENCPKILGCIIISTDMNFEVYIENRKESKKKFSKSPVVDTISVLHDLMNNVETSVTNTTFPSVLESAITLLNSVDCNLDNSEHISFIIEQLKLLRVSKNNRRYSNRTLILASTLFVQSSSAYNALLNCDYLCIPSTRVLRNIMSSYSLSKLSLAGSINYLERKKCFLNEQELVVNVLLDEIYIQPMFNFKGGSIYGGSHDKPALAAKTAQVFMITSVFSSYKDVVSIVPVNGLQANELQDMIQQILIALENIGFKVVCLISDNNAVNKRAFELMTPNKTLQPYIKHPLDDSRLLFFLFDTVHMLKSVRNNWCNKKLITFPDLENNDILKKANFKHLEIMYDIEKSSIVKYGHLLTNKALYPSTIQKQNVKLTLQVLNEKNIAALKCISKDHADVFVNSDETCDFISVFTTWWKIVNCKSNFESKLFNDKFRGAINSQNVEQINFLKKLVLWLKIWKQSVPIKETLSPQTFQALIITTDAFIQLIPYLFQKYEAEYILLGKFQTDALESRFGMYRQMSGSNYYINYLQLLESEKKLRFKSNIIISSSNINIPLTSLLPDYDKDSIFTFVNIDDYSNLLVNDFSTENVPSDILPVLVYISGYASMKELRVVKCSICQDWLQSVHSVDIADDIFGFLKELDRGKLTLPSEVALLTSSIVHFLFGGILESMEDTFLISGKQLGILYKLSCIQLGRIKL
ncbi:uncharacterized protein LOC118205330 [Stegodyphus dumicola]|uniref:uncharacterized protein LOC118205330 n=1 Tax=Stegodyphus dumicola TaxID=202533 RepID=UPI0015B00CFF|nr:uncharacterized protein LOC118205330 [Stegodyphus dumicola]